MCSNRLPADFVEAGGNDCSAAENATLELSERGTETLQILNDLFDELDHGDEAAAV